MPLSADEVEATLARCERVLAEGAPVDLAALGFWRAVAAIKRDPDWVERYAQRVGAIDQHAFELAVWPRLSMPLGTALLTGGAAAGALLVGLGGALPRPLRDLAVLAGTGALLATTHDLAHLATGEAVGIRFTAWFLGGPTRVQPGLKTDYASYLRVSPTARAAMHASGAVVTKLVPFVVLAARGRQLGAWTRRLLLGIGLAQLASDALFSTRKSDWKRALREWRIARQLRAPS